MWYVTGQNRTYLAMKSAVRECFTTLWRSEFPGKTWKRRRCIVDYEKAKQSSNTLRKLLRRWATLGQHLKYIEVGQKTNVAAEISSRKVSDIVMIFLLIQTQWNTYKTIPIALQQRKHKIVSCSKLWNENHSAVSLQFSS